MLSRLPYERGDRSMRTCRLISLLLAGALSGVAAQAQYRATILPKPISGNSYAYGVSGNVAAGIIGNHAMLWTDAGNPIDLNPVGATSSVATCVLDDIQGGYADNKPYIWYGSAASGINLQPPGSTNGRVWAVADGVQAGSVYFPSTGHAALWHGSAASFVDLGTAGAGFNGGAVVYGVSSDTQ